MTRTLTRLTPLALAIGMLAAPYAHAQQDPPAGNEAMAELAALEQNRELPAVLPSLPGLFARALQHEIDHLDGVLFIDRLSTFKRRALLKKWKKSQKEGAKG